MARCSPASARRRSLVPLALVALVIGGACASGRGSGAGEGGALRVTYRDYRTGQRMELVSESHTSKVELYSGTRTDASRKVQADEILAGTIEHLDELGFEKVASPGRAPGSASAMYTRSFEIDRAGDVAHLGTGPGSTRAELEVMNALVRDFLQLYNATAAYQIVDNPLGAAYFDAQKPQEPPLNSSWPSGKR